MKTFGYRRAWIPAPILFAIPFLIGIASASTASLLWDPNTETNLAGYRVYIGVASRAYNTNIDVGNATNWPITNVATGVLHFFAVTAYDTEGLESDFSEEVSYTPGQTNSSPESASLTMVGFNTEGCARLLARGVPDKMYRLETSADLITWTPLETFVATATSVTLTDCTANQPQRYYRLAEEPASSLLGAGR